MLKKSLAMTVVAAAGFFALIMIFGNEPATTQKKFGDIVAKEFQPASNLAEKLPEDFNSASSVNTTQATTQQLTATIGKALLNKNPSGLGKLDGSSSFQAADVQKIVDDFLANETKSFDYQSFFPEIKTSDFKIINTNDSASFVVYLNNFKEILVNLNKEANLQNVAPENVQSAIPFYDKALAEFYKLNVPQELVEIQRKEIQLLTAQKKMFQNIANYQQDPLLAFYSVQSLPLMDADFGKVKNQLVDFVVKNKISVQLN